MVRCVEITTYIQALTNRSKRCGLRFTVHNRNLKPLRLEGIGMTSSTRGISVHPPINGDDITDAESFFHGRERHIQRELCIFKILVKAIMAFRHLCYCLCKQDEE
jgi:hypothetical protein